MLRWRYPSSEAKEAKKLFLVHGDEEAMMFLKDDLETKGFNNVFLPTEGEEFELINR